MRKVLAAVVFREEGALSMEYSLLIAMITAISIASLRTPILAFPWH